MHPDIAPGQVWRNANTGALLVIHGRDGEQGLWSARRADGVEVVISADSLFSDHVIEVNRFGQGFATE
ncbi:MAG: hypothetical protein AB7L17_17380 [Ilumatobacteraceae bacterium]